MDYGEKLGLCQDTNPMPPTLPRSEVNNHLVIVNQKLVEGDKQPVVQVQHAKRH